ncbi:unnamed protein product [Linum tenue]|uniref:Uncharacterized protein n=1 Tax=Linum tenue TaxID=586396 RepID=A0AAV0J3K1_9ROSI|nr:unnamed protein product [Linum tenue]
MLLRHISDIRTLCIPDLLCLPLQKWTGRMEARECEDLWLQFKGRDLQLQHLHSR